MNWFGKIVALLLSLVVLGIAVVFTQDIDSRNNLLGYAVIIVYILACARFCLK